MLRMIGSEMTSTWAEAREIRGKEQRAEGGWLVQVNVGNISGDRARGDGPTPITNTTSHDVTCCELGQGSRSGEVDASIQAGARGERDPGSRELLWREEG